MPKEDKPTEEQEMSEKTTSDANSGSKAAPELLTYPEREELQRLLDEAEQKANQYWERILRMRAESENAERRSSKEIENAHRYAVEKWAKDLLPVIDSLELGVSNASAMQDKQANVKVMVEGVSLTLKMLHTVLEKHGIKQIDPVSSPFDPEHHQAISMQYDPDVKPGTVISVLQKGYSLNNRLLRPALVVVAKGEE